ncbi:HK97 family phage prohead protease [Cupriavidus gilardii]|uniref:HK97 family phage prohead protease n=1 Tax=Cupriavidus gilardii TaxID=82541 RepID=UPI0021B2BC11|nr:HK97 family phage prohead protease [Cupriavidus gilardii]UXC34787.1 HK97 family phage prohead protease [Cupriavidus gilardii]UXC37345.1 HK97 family phage prohead protease [Cupriavidus gilardii]
MNAQIKHKQISFKAENVSEEGSFTGYGSVFGNVDGGGDIVEKGAFAGSLERLKMQGRVVPVLWQHKTDEPIGDWANLSEDEHGLKGDGQLWVDVAPYARIAHRGMKAGAVTGLSIGYVVKNETYDHKSGITILHELDLKEISLVTFPMNDLARVDAVKSALEAGDLPTIQQFEKFLREAGFSKTQAVAIANHGLTKLLRSESGDAKAKKAASVALATLRLNL